MVNYKLIDFLAEIAMTFPAFLIACFSPLILFLTGIRQFIWVIAVVGTFVGLIEGTVITSIYKKTKRRGERTPEYSLKVPRFLLYLTIAILFSGAALQTFYYFR